MTKEMYVDPVTTEGGHTYERAFIEKWFETNSTDPFVDEELLSKDLHPNPEIRSAVEEFQRSLAVYRPQWLTPFPPTPRLEEDHQKALSLRIAELDLAYRSREAMRSFAKGMADIELCIQECIPEDIIEQLSNLLEP
eukprot:gene3530-4820_t